MTQQPSKWARLSPTIRVGVLVLWAAFLLVLRLALAPKLTVQNRPRIR